MNKQKVIKQDEDQKEKRIQIFVISKAKCDAWNQKFGFEKWKLHLNRANGFISSYSEPKIRSPRR